MADTLLLGMSEHGVEVDPRHCVCLDEGPLFLNRFRDMLVQCRTEPADDRPAPLTQRVY